MRINILDHGYLDLITSWGNDASIIEAARMSTDKGFQGWDRDFKLLKYLWTNHHLTPFEMCGAVFEVKAPIFVFREWHRHRTQSYNEMSARYIAIPNEHYVPTVQRLLHNADLANKQAQAIGFEYLTPDTAERAQNTIRAGYVMANNDYEVMLKSGVPKELARLIMPVGRYSKMRASTNLRNWLQFLTLRMDANAQWEIRQYAEAVHDVLVELFPRTMSLFDRTDFDGTD